MTKFREEEDSIGKIKVPSDKLWGAQTQRSLENFPIGKDKMPHELIKAFAIQKKASAISNIAIEKLSSDLGEKIIDVCDELISGNLYEHFPLSVWQTGSGTQTNMNLNEVIANKANQSLGKELGSYEPIHPNDHCNMGQSSNDSFPTAMHIAIVIQSHEKLIPSIEKLINTLERKKNEFKEVIKIGRTHLQDATPLSINQEFGGFSSQIKSSLSRIKISLEEIYHLAQGGTAVGTGLNSSKKFISGFIQAVQMITGYPLKESEDKFEALSSHEPILNFSGAVNTLVVACYKIANDLRLLGSGPRCGIGEITLPSNEPGSSIMPGKVNPTQCEALSQVCLHLMGLHFSLSIASSQGHFQLNANKTVILFSTLRIIQLLSDAINSFVKRCLDGLKINKEKIEENLENSLMLVTALNPKIGYSKSAEIAKKAHAEGISLKKAAVKLKYLKADEFEEIVNPKKMTKTN
ncbi:MAG: class II fumarate hydratase [Pseudomonadota bacterium]|nr:class II fumarate hydratase [Pseudomonadota bacterium]